MKSCLVWQIAHCTGGDPEAFADRLLLDGFGKVYFKFTDSSGRVNLDPDGVHSTLLHRFVDVLRAHHIEVEGWGYSYGYNVAGEALAVSQVVKEYDLKEWAFDCEKEWKQFADKGTRARNLWGTVRQNCPNLVMALCSFRFPSYHMEFPWADWLAGMNRHMPQVYWVQATDAGAQLQRSHTELMGLKALPFVPVGAAYSENGWQPSLASLQEFSNTAKSMGLSEISFWSWDTKGIEYLPAIEAVIKGMDWAEIPTVDPNSLDNRVQCLEDAFVDLQECYDGLNARVTALEAWAKQHPGSQTFLPIVTKPPEAK